MSPSPAGRPLSQVVSEPAERALKLVVGVLAVFMRVATRQDWRNQEKIPKTGAVVFVVNHISNFDPIAFGHFLVYAGRWPRYLGKASLFRVPLLGRLITACGQIPVERGGHDVASALASALQAVREGKSVSIYPEGTITADPEGWPMTGKSGAARIALQTGCPIVPVGQWGANQVMPGKKPTWPRLLPRKTMHFKAGDPVNLDDLRDAPPSPTVLREATTRIMDAITALVADLRDEVPPAERLDLRTHLANQTITELPRTRALKRGQADEQHRGDRQHRGNRR